MTISRGQMPRQMYGLGSLVKSVTKAAKGVVKGVKDVAKSPIGKAALLYTVTGGLGNLAAGKGFGSFFSGFTNPATFLGRVPGIFSTSGLQNIASRVGLGAFENVGGNRIFQMSKLGGNLLKGAAITIPAILAAAGVEEGEVEELKQDKNKLVAALERGYKNLNPIGNRDPQEYEAEVSEFVRTYSAEGGRIGYAEGNPDEKQMAMVEDMLKRGMDMDTIKTLTGASDEVIQDRINFIKYGGAKVPIA